MSNDLKVYLRNLEKNDPLNYFLFWRFYIDPKLSLNDDMFKFMQPINSSHFLLENAFLLFLKLCLNDNEFVKKLDDNLMKKIRYILFDNKETFGDILCSDIHCGDLRKYLVSKKYLNSLADKINSKIYYVSLLDQLIKKITLLEEKYCEENILPALEKEKIFKKILEDNYEESIHCFLFERHGKDYISSKYLVCDNDFLDLVKNFLINYELSAVIIENIVEILQIGVNFKTLRIEDKFVSNRLLTKEKIQNYRYKDAVELISQLKAKEPMKEKIIPFSYRKRIGTI